MTYATRVGDHSEALTRFNGPHIHLSFQDGPVAEFGENGTTNEEIIQLLISRIQSLNMIFPSEYNNAALTNLETALYMLEKRTQDRQRRGVEGTMQP